MCLTIQLPYKDVHIKNGKLLHCTRIVCRSTASDPSKRKAYLPDAKQYLVTKNGMSSPFKVVAELSLS